MLCPKSLSFEKNITLFSWRVPTWESPWTQVERDLWIADLASRVGTELRNEPSFRLPAVTPSFRGQQEGAVGSLLRKETTQVCSLKLEGSAGVPRGL